MHDLFIVGVPLIAILAGILFNRSEMQSLRSELRGELKDVRSEMKDLRSDMKDLRSEMNARFDRIDAELRYFHGVTGRLEGRIEALEKR